MGICMGLIGFRNVCRVLLGLGCGVQGLEFTLVFGAFNLSFRTGFSSSSVSGFQL